MYMYLALNNSCCYQDIKMFIYQTCAWLLITNECYYQDFVEKLSVKI